MDSKFALSNLLKRSREKSLLSQAQVAAELGYKSPQFISNWERGLSKPPISKIKKLCRIYKIKVEEAYQATLLTEVAEIEIKLKKQFFGKKK